MFARLEVEQQLAGQRVGLALNVGLHARSLKKRMTVMIQVAKFGGNVPGEFFA